MLILMNDENELALIMLALVSHLTTLSIMTPFTILGGLLYLVVGVVFLIIGIIVIAVLIGALIFFLPAIIVAVVVWFLTGSLFLGGIAFLLIAVISVAAKH